MSARTRRRFLASGAIALSVGASGCTSGNFTGEEPMEAGTASATETPACRDEPCESIAIPGPDEPTSGGAEPTDYPDVPDSVTAEAAESFAVAFEKAFRRNDFVANAGARETASLSLRAGSAKTESLDCGFAVAVDGSIRSEPPTFTAASGATSTPTPVPYYDDEFATWYLVSTEQVRRVALGGNFRDPMEVPTFEDATVVFCP